MDHTLMRFPVRVVSRADFDTWLAGQKQAQQPGK
jgi:heme/copper-type cytochrome/quinol oxidase subunit 2